MPIVALTASRDVLGRLPNADTVTVSVVRSTAAENPDGTWSVTAYTTDDQIPALEALGCEVRVVVTESDMQDRWASVEIFEPPDA